MSLLENLRLRAQEMIGVKLTADEMRMAHEGATRTEHGMWRDVGIREPFDIESTYGMNDDTVVVKNKYFADVSRSAYSALQMEQVGHGQRVYTPDGALVRETRTVTRHNMIFACGSLDITYHEPGKLFGKKTVTRT
ncbi:TPA: hypothetical protein HA251_06085 [Candidatus Woesearchaeota archaeon]|nr:hypothetical protein [Candidatus Woesearchaeota archaeon]